jgi:hypothetical protein
LWLSALTLCENTRVRSNVILPICEPILPRQGIDIDPKRYGNLDLKNKANDITR